MDTGGRGQSDHERSEDEGPSGSTRVPEVEERTGEGLLKPAGVPEALVPGRDWLLLESCRESRKAAR